MNPSRLCRLFDAKFGGGVRNGHRKDGSGGTRYVDLSPMEDEDGTGLAAYFTTGGG